MVTFHNVKDALNYCTQVQRELLLVDWPTGILLNENCAKMNNQDGLIWSGLRVRMSVSCGSTDIEYDKSINKVDYFGTVVNLASRVLDVSAGGQVLVTEEVYESPECHDFDMEYVKEYEFKGIKGRRKIYQLITIEGRSFDDCIGDSPRVLDVAVCNQCMRPCNKCQKTALPKTRLNNYNSIRRKTSSTISRFSSNV
eukprot:NODE_3402_length_1358_cov_27.085020_g2965_i0.p1 GENE.NODE_3402_length_1358_cov_27.085020_g2965_i0~~NODE_3402_length_1358_cov_27.085020_g2965_i0.p1  ORF type:complete len:216 (+),score=39.87 NODE_3402_length_1358_cov_27.085020_g2965_i0:58-648(+)